MRRRDFLGLSALGVVGALPGRSALAAAPAASSPKTGSLQAFDDFVSGFMHKWQIPAGSAAVAKNGRLVYARGFGHVDLAKTQAVTVKHRFRIASSSKPVTAVAIMKLVQERKLKLDESAFDRLPHLRPPSGQHEDPELRTITVRHLLEHSGGFDSRKTDPQFDALRIAADAVGHPRPATQWDLIRYMMGEPLAFAPGTQYIYSNFGYNVLGRIIEQVSGMTYNQYIQREILHPIGVHEMELGRTKPKDRLPNEVEYWDDPFAPPYYSVYQDDPLPRTYSYGGFSMEAIDAHGGWVARAADLTRFLDSVGGATGTQLLHRDTVEEMLTRPKLAQYRGAAHFYGLGWDVGPGKIVMSHNGALTWGTASTITRLPNGVTLALCFNRLGYNLVNFVESLASRSAEVAGGISDWPDKDSYASLGVR